MHECRTKFDDGEARDKLAHYKDVKPEGALCIFAMPSTPLKPATDYWEVNKGQTITRHHDVPRTKLYTVNNDLLPEGLNKDMLADTRFTKIQFINDSGEVVGISGAS